MGAPPNNSNAVKHGLSLPVGKAPRGAEYVTRRISKLRRLLENAVELSMPGGAGLTIEQAANIQTALRWEQHAQLAVRWLREAFDDLSNVERLEFSRETARASERRDAAIARLNLAGRQRAAILTIYDGPGDTQSDATIAGRIPPAVDD